jgi:hypothetical protein
MAYTLEDARTAKEKARGLFPSDAGLGITKIGSDYAVKVNLSSPVSDLDNLPTSIDGVPVQVEVVGQIKKR